MWPIQAADDGGFIRNELTDVYNWGFYVSPIGVRAAETMTTGPELILLQGCLLETVEAWSPPPRDADAVES